MTDDTILLIGLDTKKVNLSQLFETDRYYKLTDIYGESILPY